MLLLELLLRKHVTLHLISGIAVGKIPTRHSHVISGIIGEEDRNIPTRQVISGHPTTNMQSEIVGVNKNAASIISGNGWGLGKVFSHIPRLRLGSGGKRPPPFPAFNEDRSICRGAGAEKARERR